MNDNKVEEYNEEEAENFAMALAQKKYHEAIAEGISYAESQRKSQDKYNEVRKRHVLEFLKKVEEKLSTLSNQDVANLLRILIALGLDIEYEEELEYWVNKLIHESLNRIALYFKTRDNISLWRQLTTQPKTQKILYNLKNYSNNDIKCLLSMVKSLKKFNKKNLNKKSKDQRDNILKKIDKVLNKDIKLKLNQKQRQQQSRNRSKSKNPKDILIDKMSAEGIKNGGRYWNEVVSEFNRSNNKNNFANKWKIDRDRYNELDIKPINDKQREDERILAENKEHQRIEEENKQSQQEQEKIREQKYHKDLDILQMDNVKKDEEDRKKREREIINEKRGIQEKKSQNENNSNQKQAQQQSSAVKNVGNVGR